jgi:hypothetical protein
MPEKQRKTMILCTRIDERSYRVCLRAAKAAGLRLTDWIRDRLSRAAKRDLTA